MVTSGFDGRKAGGRKLRTAGHMKKEPVGKLGGRRATGGWEEGVSQDNRELMSH